MRFSYRERLANLEGMARDGVDILVVGGGITGCGVAMDGVARGYRVGLVERADFASGTSSKSTKLLHGGIRYLPQFDLAMVREGLVERGLMFQNAPWIAKPLGFVLPLFDFNKRPMGVPFATPGGLGLDWMMETGLAAYELFAGRYNIGRHRRLSLDETRKRAPSLKTEGLRHAFLYYDGQVDDARLTLAVLRTAVARGALAANYAAVTGFSMRDGSIAAATVVDQLNHTRYEIRAAQIVNAAGIHAQRIAEMTGLPSEIDIAPAKGVHLMFPRGKLPMASDAVVLPETDDGRLLFVIPWRDQVMLGTTDTSGGDPDRPVTDNDDVRYLLTHARRYLNASIAAEDITSSFAGYRPLIRSRKQGSAASSRLSRSHAVLFGPAGMISIIGGKLTTWRKMAEDTVDSIAQRDGRSTPTTTRDMALDGTSGWSTAADRIAGNATILPDTRARLISAYGANALGIESIMADDPALGSRIVPVLAYVMAEVVYACRSEMAMTLDDVLSRRTRIVIEDRSQGRSAAAKVAKLMASELGWDDAEIATQINRYLSGVNDEYQPAGRPV